MLTKSNYLIGLQCLKYLWISINQPNKIPEPDLATQHRFDEGKKVEKLVKKLFPNSIDLSKYEFEENLEKTKEALKERRVLFEPGFLFNNCYSRCDILVPVNKDEWDIIEVKCGSRVKKENLDDVSFQKFVYNGTGLKIRNCYLMHTNKEYIRNGKINVNELFVKEEINEKVDKKIEGINGKIEIMLDVINSSSFPSEIKVGSHCKSPYKCPIEECWSNLPKNNVFNLYRGGRISKELFENGILSIKDIPDSVKLNSKQEIQRNCLKKNEVFLDKVKIKEFLGNLKYPLYFLDFETFDFSVPKFDDARPWQKIPFQFSLHKVSENGEINHYEFLYDGKEDPRKEFILELKKVLDLNGSVIVYNESFETNIIRELSKIYPEFSEFINNVLDRVVDLLVVFRNFHYYNSIQEGSASIKKVLPAITGKGYDDLEISDGGIASVKFLKLYDNDDKKIREELLKYCELDTEGMVDILGKLKRIV